MKAFLCLFSLLLLVFQIIEATHDTNEASNPPEDTAVQTFIFKLDTSDGSWGTYSSEAPLSPYTQAIYEASKSESTRCKFVSYRFYCAATLVTSLRALVVTCTSESDCKVRLEAKEGKTLGQHKFTFQFHLHNEKEARFIPVVGNTAVLIPYSNSIQQALRADKTLLPRFHFENHIGNSRKTGMYFYCSPYLATSVHELEAECESESKCQIHVHLKPGMTIGANKFNFKLDVHSKEPFKYTTDAPYGHMRHYLDAILEANYYFGLANLDAKLHCDLALSIRESSFSCSAFDANVRALVIVCSNEFNCKIRKIQWANGIQRVWHTGRLLSS